MTKFGATIRKLREEKGKSMVSMAEALGFTTPYVCDIERDKRNPPSEDKLKIIADFLEIPFEDVIDLANKHRGKVELGLEGKSESLSKLALTLGHRWGSLTDSEAERILEVLR